MWMAAISWSMSPWAVVLLYIFVLSAAKRGYHETASFRAIFKCPVICKGKWRVPMEWLSEWSYILNVGRFWNRCDQPGRKDVPHVVQWLSDDGVDSSLWWWRPFAHSSILCFRFALFFTPYFRCFDNYQCVISDVTCVKVMHSGCHRNINFLFNRVLILHVGPNKMPICKQKKKILQNWNDTGTDFPPHWFRHPQLFFTNFASTCMHACNACVCVCMQCALHAHWHVRWIHSQNKKMPENRTDAIQIQMKCPPATTGTKPQFK